MSVCNFSRLLQFTNKQLDLDGQLEIYDHLDRCDICRDAFYQLSRDRHEASRTQRKTIVMQHPIAAAVGSLTSGG